MNDTELFLVCSMLAISALGVIILVRNEFVFRARVYMVDNDELWQADYYRLLPSYYEMLENPKYWLLWTPKHWVAWVNRNKITK